MQDQALPRYSTIYKAPPRYSTVFIHDHYSFPLKNSKGKTWAVVSLRNEHHRSASFSAKHVPIIAEGASPITGWVKLDLNSPETIQGITLALRGHAITGANEGGSHTFLDHITSLWSKDQGDPHNFGNSGNASRTNFWGGKLLGTYTFPFSIILPIGDATGGSLPETFREQASGVRVRYELVLKIGRRRLKADSKLRIPIEYRRKTTPSPASELRQLAYQENTAAPGPGLDPCGWTTFSPVDCIGRLLNCQTVILRCTLSLANPLSYTRGSFIPCHLRIESVDEQALDLLASPRTTMLRLCRRVKYLFDAGQGMQQNGKSTASRPRYETSNVGQAVWSHDQNFDVNGINSRVRWLTGEIPLSKELPPSSDVLSFGAEYAVVLLPFESATFLPERDTQLQTYKVEIATEYAEGPAPTSRRASVNQIEASWATSATRDEPNAIAASHSNPFQLVT
ncbi:hypothetical protein J3R30DRAFT_823196 [Lentinula aciculospora]|uniref:Arrestin-like N-terminal domain-containing protein n=1 Tax=Lentinula aciculospora TaxID=153920 RepID=A0A9W9ADL1_9AGAR|nr:hypothetical protein J3R30DRAFT_2908531 [Lentinula aciculospora]KAJ4487621.1 hypothetical protein J3R30DRAFT_823196 [Lentinula aciculospora]